MLGHLGYTAPAQLIGADQANLKGHWEARPIARFNDRMLEFSGSNWRDWQPLNRNWHGTPYFNGFVEEGVTILNEVFGNAPMIVLKDPRLCRLTAVWQEILKVSGFSTTVFLPLRHPAEVAASLGARNKIDPAQAQYLWLRYMLDAELGTRKDRRFLFRYADFVHDWRGTLRRAEKRIGAKFPRLNDCVANTVDSFVDQALYRNRASKLASAGDLHPLVAEAHEIFTDWASTGERPGDHQRLDEIDVEFSSFSGRARPLFVVFDHIQEQLNGLESSIVRHKARIDGAGAPGAALASVEGPGIPEIGEATSPQGDDIDRLQIALAELSYDLLGDTEGLRAALAQFAKGEGDASLTKLAKAKFEAEIAQLKNELGSLREHSDKQISEAEGRFERAQKSEADAAAAVEQARSAKAELESRVSVLASELEQKRAETDDIYAERDELKNEVAALKAQVEAAVSNEGSLNAQLARNSDELLTSLNDLVALGNLLRNEEQKCTKLAADRKVFEKRIREQELKLSAARTEIVEIRQQYDTKLQDWRNEQAERKAVKNKLINLRVRHKAVSEEAATYERQLMLADRQLKLNDVNVAVSSRILDEMSKRRVSFPESSSRSKFLANIPSSSMKRWQQFCRILTESGIFDPESYLALHPDVAASGVDPLIHFLTHGLAEGRTLDEGADRCSLR
ncbi:hypothetical protein LZ496_10710 [Sphingomonas sp. NSE70-1]|uniref:Chromosome partition protein Smc n=1 Tax=Sphingomonas caseinilyticus TaxID=2908205 RepID=A0ABT0RW58_9SPHN|nr:hypothetical protein [Sphingomonas caseinilyticus]MCL6699249.1 hypothetical protein [Sphingomonas caseinilyticus]